MKNKNRAGFGILVCMSIALAAPAISFADDDALKTKSGTGEMKASEVPCPSGSSRNKKNVVSGSTKDKKSDGKSDASVAK